MGINADILRLAKILKTWCCTLKIFRTAQLDNELFYFFSILFFHVSLRTELICDIFPPLNMWSCRFQHSLLSGNDEHQQKKVPSSCWTFLKKGQKQQLTIFLAEIPIIESKHIVPAIFQQNLPAFFPLLTPWWVILVDAGQTPSSLDLLPLGSRPHFMYSQQFIFFCMFSPFHNYSELLLTPQLG